MASLNPPNTVTTQAAGSDPAASVLLGRIPPRVLKTVRDVVIELLSGGKSMEGTLGGKRSPDSIPRRPPTKLVTEEKLRKLLGLQDPEITSPNGDLEAGGINSKGGDP